MQATCSFDLMGDEAVRTGERPAAASTTLAGCSLPAALEIADAPLWAWQDPDGSAHLGTGEAVRIVADGATRFGTLEDGLEALTDRLDASATGPRAFIGARFFHEAPRRPSAWDPYPAAVATVPSVQLGWDQDGDVTLTVVEVDGPTDLDHRLEIEAARFEGATELEGTTPAATARRYRPDPEQWRQSVREATHRLSHPPTEKAVLAAECQLELTTEPSLGATMAELSRRHPECWRFCHAPNSDTTFIGATPERLASLDDRQLQTVALAGTIGRGETGIEDDSLRERLLARETDRHEQANVVGDIVERLGGKSDAIRIGNRRVRTLSDVQHIETPIEADLRDGIGLLDVAGELHPTPAVGGRPRASALALIRELESIERGWYAAPFGILDPAGNGTLAVAIRSARIDGSEATLYAGNGIVQESDPNEEWEELLLKFQAIAEIFDG